MTNEDKRAGSTKGVDQLPTADGARVRMGQAALRGLFPAVSLLVVCFITISLILGGHERTIVGTLVPGSQEWLHYHFFHLHKERGRP